MPTVVACGAVNWDTTCFVDHLPNPGEEVVCGRVTEVSGGTGANVAVAAARILGPGQVGFLGALGRDRVAQTQISGLRAEGVATDAIVRVRNYSSGHAYIFVDHSGQNVIASDLGANAALAPRHITPSRLAPLLSGCRCVALTDPPLPVSQVILTAASRAGIPTLWDPGVVASLGWDALAPIAANADSLVLNDAEANQLFGVTEPDDIIRRLDTRGAPTYILLKRGSRGSLLLECATGDTTPIPPLPLTALGLSVVSAVGCGDVFLGAFAAYLSLGKERCESLAIASAAAGLNATRPETRGGPTQALLDTVLMKAQRRGYKADSAEGNTA